MKWFRPFWQCQPVQTATWDASESANQPNSMLEISAIYFAVAIFVAKIFAVAAAKCQPLSLRCVSLLRVRRHQLWWPARNDRSNLVSKLCRTKGHPNRWRAALPTPYFATDCNSVILQMNIADTAAIQRKKRNLSWMATEKKKRLQLTFMNVMALKHILSLTVASYGMRGGIAIPLHTNASVCDNRLPFRFPFKPFTVGLALIWIFKFGTYTASPYWSRVITVNCVGHPKRTGSSITFSSHLFGSSRDSGCSQAANRAPDEPGTASTKSFKNCRSFELALKILKEKEWEREREEMVKILSESKIGSRSISRGKNQFSVVNNKSY